MVENRRTDALSAEWNRAPNNAPALAIAEPPTAVSPIAVRRTEVFALNLRFPRNEVFDYFEMLWIASLGTGAHRHRRQQ